MRIHFIEKSNHDAKYECEEPGARLIVKKFTFEQDRQIFKVTVKHWVYSYDYREFCVIRLDEEVSPKIK